MLAVKFLDKLAFIVSVSSGAVAAIAGGCSWTQTAVVAGCIAVVTPILNRWTSGRLAFAPRMLSTRDGVQNKSIDFTLTTSSPSGEFDETSNPISRWFAA